MKKVIFIVFLIAIILSSCSKARISQISFSVKAKDSASLLISGSYKQRYFPINVAISTNHLNIYPKIKFYLRYTLDDTTQNKNVLAQIIRIPGAGFAPVLWPANSFQLIPVTTIGYGNLDVNLMREDSNLVKNYIIHFTLVAYSDSIESGGTIIQTIGPSEAQHILRINIDSKKPNFATINISYNNMWRYFKKDLFYDRNMLLSSLPNAINKEKKFNNRMLEIKIEMV